MPSYQRPILQVLIGGRDYTEHVETVSFSATDQGGFEIATLGMPEVERPPKGAQVTIRYGTEVAWFGRVAETGEHSQHLHLSKTIGCEGYVALLKDNRYSMVYVDRELSRWGAPSLSRRRSLIETNFTEGAGSSSAVDDPTTNLPALQQTVTGEWKEPFKPLSEAWYDAGPSNAIGKLYFNLLIGPLLGGGLWTQQLNVSADPNAATTETSGNQDSGGAGAAGYFTPVNAYRYALAQHFYNGTNAGAVSAEYAAWWRNLAVYGNHGLTGRGADPVGFYPSDIARHALSQVGGIQTGIIEDAIGYIVPHFVCREPTEPDKVMEEMAKLTAWTWGVWEPFSILDTQPRLDFRAPPSEATAVTRRAECDELDITSTIADLYDICEVTYTDTAGREGLVIIELANPLLYEAGITHRTLQLNAGVSASGEAETLGQFALALSQVASRAVGQATLPAYVSLVNGGSKPACLLRPGRDRLRIFDAGEGVSPLEQGNSRRDVYRIKRVENTASKEGLKTVAELDNGQNILETLQARLALAAGVVGSGAG